MRSEFGVISRIKEEDEGIIYKRCYYQFKYQIYSKKESKSQLKRNITTGTLQIYSLEDHQTRRMSDRKRCVQFRSGKYSTVPGREEVNDGRQLIGSAEEEDVDCVLVQSFVPPVLI